MYRVDATTGDCRIVADEFDRPNGLAFSLDESEPYIADTRANHIRVFGVADGALTAGRIIASGSVRGFDGVRFDTQGRVWVAAGDGVHCFDPDGTLIGKPHIPEATSNLVFGGPKRNRLFVTATTSATRCSPR